MPGAPLRATRAGGEPGAAEDGGADAHLLVCRQCDHVFAPQYYRYCAWCGQDAEMGLEVDEVARLSLSPLGWWIVLATGGLVLLVLGYFRWLFQR